MLQCGLVSFFGQGSAAMPLLWAQDLTGSNKSSERLSSVRRARSDLCASPNPGSYGPESARLPDGIAQAARRELAPLAEQGNDP